MGNVRYGVNKTVISKVRSVVFLRGHKIRNWGLPHGNKDHNNVDDVVMFNSRNLLAALWLLWQCAKVVQYEKLLCTQGKDDVDYLPMAKPNACIQLEIRSGVSWFLVNLGQHLNSLLRGRWSEMSLKCDSESYPRIIWTGKGLHKLEWLVMKRFSDKCLFPRGSRVNCDSIIYSLQWCRYKDESHCIREINLNNEKQTRK